MIKIKLSPLCFAPARTAMPMLLESLTAARDLGRLNTIARVLIRHGLGDAVHRLGLADSLARAGELLMWPHAADLARLEAPQQVRLAMEELGPTFVKLGQILAGRADLLAPEWIAEFEKLHNQVPAVPFEALRVQLREDWGCEPEAAFARFDLEPLAAASIAQVHAAQLQDGTEVVVKIRRPGIAETLAADLRLLHHLAALAEQQWAALRPLQPQQLVRELDRSLQRELDLAQECRNAERIARDQASLPWVLVPRVHWAWTRARVNVQSRVQGIPGHHLAELDAQGLDRRLLAQRGAQSVLKMIVEDGLFHADPHPGNVFYLPGNRIAFIDFGMVGQLTRRRREQLLRLLLGLVQRDPSAVSDVLLDWTGNAREVDTEQLETEIEAFVDRYHGVPLAQLALGQMFSDVTSLLRDHRLALPSDLALLVKAFITLEGMGRGLDPEFHMAEEALPLLRRALRERYRPRLLMRRGQHALQRALALIEQGPHDLARLLQRLRRGQLRIGLDVAHVQQLGEQISEAANRMAMALVIAALIVGSSIVMTVQGGPTLLGLPAFGFVGFVGAVLGGIWLLRLIARSHRRPSR
jgi:ubiquinone biosynthesis protein